MKKTPFYDAVIVGGGHNGLICSCYLAQAGLRVLVLEKNETIGGATCSKKIFPGFDARISVYSYLVSLLPEKITSDLGIQFTTRRREFASYTPIEKDGRSTGLLISNVSEETTRRSFSDLTGDEREHQRYCQLQQKLGLFARKVWPTLLDPLPSRQALRSLFHTREERRIWEYLVEQPLSALIEDHIQDDTLRGVLFTDAKIGVLTDPEDPSLLQNRTFLYHIIGQGSGEWRVPVGGMGALVDALKARAAALGVEMETGAAVTQVDPSRPHSGVYYIQNDTQKTAAARCVLFNAASNVVNQCLPGAYPEDQVDGSVFKINLLLKKLPTLKDARVSAREAFSGTYHLDEGYTEMKISAQNARGGVRSDRLPGELYCHSLTDPSILSSELREQGFHTLTLFGLDVPYAWFIHDNARVKDEITASYLRALDQTIVEDLLDCLAVDENGQTCVDAKSPLDLEESLGLPKGNIFHGNLTWPFSGPDGETGAWGVETKYENILICGSSAKRGGAVSGIPGHNAAMKVLGLPR